MHFAVVEFVAAAALLLSAAISAEYLQVAPSQGILVPERVVRSAYGGSAPSYAAPAAPSYSAPAAPSSYSSGATIPAPRCPKNYIMSCQPSLAPVPCSSGSSYSAPAQSYSAPAAPSYSAPAAPSYSAPAAPSYSAPAAPSYSGGLGAPPMHQAAYSHFVPQYAVPVPIVRELY